MTTFRRWVQFGGIAAVTLLLTASSLTVRTMKPNEQAELKVLTIPAAEFVPYSDSQSYLNPGLSLRMLSGGGDFVAPVDLPDTAYIKSIILYAYDESPAYSVCAAVYRAEPAQYTSTWMTEICTSGMGGNQSVSTWNLNPQLVSVHHKAYIYLHLGNDTNNLRAYGVKIKYR
jgi:hypothetical protein